MAIKRLTRIEFIEKSKSKWGDRYSYDKVEYLNSRTPVELFCNKHHIYFTQTPKAHFMAKRECCPLCYKEISGLYQNLWRDNKSNVEPAVNIELVNKKINVVFS